MRKALADKVIDQYMKQNCNEDGSQKASNLTAREKIGLTRLIKRVKDGTLVICTSDKGKKLVVVEMSCYIRMGEKHTINDKVVEWEEIRAKQRDLTSHSPALCNIFMETEMRRGHGRTTVWKTAPYLICI